MSSFSLSWAISEGHLELRVQSFFKKENENGQSVNGPDRVWTNHLKLFWGSDQTTEQLLVKMQSSTIRVGLDSLSDIKNRVTVGLRAQILFSWILTEMCGLHHTRAMAECLFYKSYWLACSLCPDCGDVLLSNRQKKRVSSLPCVQGQRLEGWK